MKTLPQTGSCRRSARRADWIRNRATSPVAARKTAAATRDRRLSLRQGVRVLLRGWETGRLRRVAPDWRRSGTAAERIDHFPVAGWHAELCDDEARCCGRRSRMPRRQLASRPQRRSDDPSLSKRKAENVLAREGPEVVQGVPCMNGGAIFGDGAKKTGGVRFMQSGKLKSCTTPGEGLREAAARRGL